MDREYIITMTAVNRVGILAAVTKAMAELGGDLREASQTVVRGFFTMIFSSEFPADLAPDVIIDHLQDACRPFGIEVSLKEVGKQHVDSEEDARLSHFSLRLGGENQKGVLKELSSAISMRRIDIAGMHAVRTRGGKGFEMVMKIAVPPDFDMQGFLSHLHELGRPFNITADVSDYS